MIRPPISLSKEEYNLARREARCLGGKSQWKRIVNSWDAIMIQISKEYCQYIFIGIKYTYENHHQSQRCTC